jgi:hypothetical protein
MENKPKIVFIIGMHRSGTSLLSNCLVENGFSIGKTKNTDKDWQNPNGYFENDAFTHLHDKLLNYNNSSWCSITKEKMDYTQDHIEEYKHLLKTEFDNLNLILIKDPRLTFFVDFLKEVCSNNYEYKFLFLKRNKKECCNSLSKAQNKNIEVCKNLYDITMSKYCEEYLMIDHNDIIYKNDLVIKDISKYININLNNNTSDLVDMDLYRNRAI